MLVLSRRKGEVVWVGDVAVQVVQCGRGRVRLAFDAPAHVRVVRGELERFETTDQETTHDVQKI